MRRSLSRFSSRQDLALTAAGWVLERALEALAARGRFTLVLSGGKLSMAVYGELAAPPLANRFPWRRTHVLFGDELAVPPDLPSSNYCAARRALLDRVPIPPTQVHRIPAERLRLEDVAAAYQAQVEDTAANREGPSLDVALLEIDESGAAGSIFPGSSALVERERLVLPVTSPDGMAPRRRVTLTLQAFSLVEYHAVLVGGAGARRVAEAVLGGDREVSRLPAARLTPRQEQAWFLT